MKAFLQIWSNSLTDFEWGRLFWIIWWALFRRYIKAGLRTEAEREESPAVDNSFSPAHGVPLLKFSSWWHFIVCISLPSLPFQVSWISDLVSQLPQWHSKFFVKCLLMYMSTSSSASLVKSSTNTKIQRSEDHTIVFLYKGITYMKKFVNSKIFLIRGHKFVQT